MYVITFIIYVLYLFNMWTESFRILTHNLNNANVFSSSFIVLSAWSWTQKQICFSSCFLQNVSFYKTASSYIFNLTNFNANAFFMYLICSKIFFDSTFRSVFFVYTCFSLYLIHVWMLDYDVNFLSVRFSLRILF